MRQRLMRGAVAILLAHAVPAWAENYCGELKNNYGPLDYRLRGSVNLEIVEEFHFTPEVEQGIKGSSSYLGGDLDYTLRAIPNHARALQTLATVAIRDKVVMVPYTKWPVECYFQRAERFAPDDGTVRAIYGNYLVALGRNDDALAVMKEAIALLPNDPTVNYNLGLLYAKLKDYRNAAKYAAVAYAAGFPLPGLKNKLIEAGQWHPPTAAPGQPE